MNDCLDGLAVISHARQSAEPPSGTYVAVSISIFKPDVEIFSKWHCPLGWWRSHIALQWLEWLYKENSRLYEVAPYTVFSHALLVFFIFGWMTAMLSPPPPPTIPSPPFHWFGWQSYQMPGSTVFCSLLQCVVAIHCPFVVSGWLQRQEKCRRPFGGHVLVSCRQRMELASYLVGALIPVTYIRLYQLWKQRATELQASLSRTVPSCCLHSFRNRSCTSWKGSDVFFTLPLFSSFHCDFGGSSLKLRIWCLTVVAVERWNPLSF